MRPLLVDVSVVRSYRGAGQLTKEVSGPLLQSIPHLIWGLLQGLTYSQYMFTIYNITAQNASPYRLHRQPRGIYIPPHTSPQLLPAVMLFFKSTADQSRSQLSVRSAYFT